MSFRTRGIAALTGAFALLATTVAPASAQEVDTYYIQAQGSTLDLSLLGTHVGSFAGTSAVAENLPQVTSSSFGFKGPDSLLDVAVTNAVATSLGDVVRDPQGDGADCGVPALPAEIPVAALLSVADVCSSAYAAMSAASQPAALAVADAGSVTINGAAISDLVLDIVLDPILAQLNGVTGQLEGLVLGPVEAAIADLCAALPAEVSVGGLLSTVESAGVPLTEVIQALPNGQDILDSLSSDCLLGLSSIQDLVATTLGLIESLVRDALAAALDVDLLEVTIGSSASTIESTLDAAIARSDVNALRVATPSLGMLLDALDNLVTVQLQGLINQVVAALPAELATVTAAVPTLDTVLDPALGLLDLTGIIDNAPLLDLTLAESVAQASAPLGGGDVDISGSKAGAAVLRISPAIAGLLGIPAEFSIAPSVNQVIAEGTPLESSISVGQIERITDTLGTGAVTTSGVRVTATEINLLTGVAGGLSLAVAPSVAQMGGTLSVTAPPQTSLPTTGSQDTIALALAMALAVGALALNRRRTALIG